MCCKCCDREGKKPEPVAIAPAPPQKPEKLHYEALLGLVGIIIMAAVGIALGGVQ